MILQLFIYSEANYLPCRSVWQGAGGRQGGGGERCKVIKLSSHNNVFVCEAPRQLRPGRYVNYIPRCEEKTMLSAGSLILQYIIRIFYHL